MFKAQNAKNRAISEAMNGEYFVKCSVTLAWPTHILGTIKAEFCDI